MLFKILHGDESRISLDITPFHEGYCYVTHDGYMYIDMNIGTTDVPNNQRIKLNSANAETLCGLSLEELQEKFITNPEIPVGFEVDPIKVGDVLGDTIYFDTTRNLDEWLASLTYGTDTPTVPIITEEGILVAADCTVLSGGAISGYEIATSDGSTIIYLTQSAYDSLVEQSPEQATAAGITKAGWIVDSYTNTALNKLVVATLPENCDFIYNTPAAPLQNTILERVDGEVTWSPATKYATKEQLDGYLTEHQDISNKADLVDGKIPVSQLPSYVDDVLEYDTYNSFPMTGESGKIYVTLDTNRTYRWSGSVYIEITSKQLPEVTVADNNKLLMVVDGAWAAVALETAEEAEV